MLCVKCLPTVFVFVFVVNYRHGYTHIPISAHDGWCVLHMLIDVKYKAYTEQAHNMAMLHCCSD